ncbi:MAG: peptidoglycan DD-metalloendopeptidase family protein [Candidatus Nealsonbacteria bacterium]|nr:peptidoglycan DD-metalloendopeptidase family protein [Candidatus Nealsonbacteria bacterium]
MTDSSDQLKSIIKPLIAAFILIVFVCACAPEKEESPPSLLDLSTKESVAGGENIFVDPAQKNQPELPELVLEQENSVHSILPPFTMGPKVLGALVEGFDAQELEKKTITEYLVEEGDNMWSIAAKFNVSLESILWANDMNSRSIIQPGDEIIIPPVSGVIHHVKKGDTVDEIAEYYDADGKDIVAFNQLSGEGDIYIGDILIIPGGVMPAPTVKAEVVSAPSSIPLGDSYFICPISRPCTITQRLHWYNAIDFSHGKCGEPIYAAAGGEVLKVKLTDSTSPWAFNGAGNHITILHPNGVVTMYGHISTSLVSPGDQVSQGEMIALMGGQPGTPGAGQSTGCHLHFGVRGAKNPFAQ